jgi:hypothetical protein
MPTKKLSTTARGAVNLRLERAVGAVPRSIATDKGYVLADEEKEEQQARPPLLHPALRHVLGTPLTMAFAGYTPLPRVLHAKLKYVSDGLSLSGGVTPGSHVFSANGLYDPDITGTGHQPRGFDQIIPLYDHYVVTKSTVRVQMYSRSSDVSIVGGIALLNVSTGQTDFIDYMEQARVESSMLPYYLTSGAQPEPRVHYMRFNAKEFMGVPDPLTAGKLQGTVSANPSDGAFYHIFAQATNGSTSCTVTALVEVEYDVMFIEPVPVASS